MSHLKQYVFSIIDETGKDKRANRIFDSIIVSFIILSVTAIILESYEGLQSRYSKAFWYFELVSVIVFTIEYLLRVWTADLKYPNLSALRARWRFITSGFGIIDFLAILPFYLPFIVRLDLRFVRILRVMRLLRILKLNRYTKALNIVSAIFAEKRSELGLTVMVTFLMLLMSSTIMYYLEHDVQPDQFPDIISTFWWAVATLTTVGYGDVYPVTGWGKFMSGIIALLGIGLVALPTGILSAAFIEKLEDDEPAPATSEKGPRFCPHCGERLRD